MSSRPNLDRGKAVNSSTPVRDLAGTILVVFGRYVLNFYVGIVEYILHETKTGHITIYLALQLFGFGREQKTLAP